MLQHLSIRYKIGVIALIGVLGFAIFQIANYRLSINIRDHLESIVSEDFALLKFANDMQVEFSDLDKLYQASLAEADMDTLIEADDKSMQMKLQFEYVKDSFSLNDPLFNELQSLFFDYSGTTSRHTLLVLENKLDYEHTLEGYTKIGLLRERYVKVQTQLLDERYRAFKKQLIIIEQDEAYIVQFGLILGVLLTLILLLFSYLIIRSLVLAFDNAVTVAEQIASGNLEQKIDVVAQDETGKLMHSLHVMRDVLKRQSEEGAQREYIQRFLSGLNETMRGDQSVEKLTAAILEYLSHHFQAQLGSLFLLSNENMLYRVAVYAYPEDEQLQQSFKLGEAVIGQAALDKRAQILNDIPDDYVQINTSVGQASPRSILLVPVLFENRLEGLIELAAFKSFSEDDLLLLRSCNESIAIAIHSAQSRVKMASLLELEQKQASELESQSKKLSNSNIKLAERSQELDKQNAQLEQSRSALLEKSQALEISGRYKSQFLSTMSHELRTPLNSILILSDALKSNIENSLTAKQVQHAEVINTAGADLLLLINDILDLSKVEEGKMDMLIDQVDVRHFADNISKLFEYQVCDKSLEFKVGVANNIPEHFYTDEHRLTQIVKNFVSNAIKFTAKGRISINITRPAKNAVLQRDGLTSDNTVMISVADTGLGIAKDKQALVFEAFKQADGSTSRKFGGTGLGLTISTELARLLGGEITLHSDGEGAGSEFSLILPIGSPSSINTVRNDFKADDFSNEDDVYSISDSAVLTDVLLISSDKILQKNIHTCLECSAQTHSLSFSDRDQVGDIQHLNLDMHSKLLLLDSDAFSDDDWQWVDDYLQAVQGKYGVAVIFADLILQEKVEMLGAIFIDRSLLFNNEESTFEVLLSVFSLTQVDQKKALVVEDNPVFNEVIRVLFEKNSVPVMIAKTGAQALNLLRNPDFSSLIVDLNLPDYSDVGLLSRIRKMPVYRDVNLTVFTAEDLDLARSEKVQKYANQIVVKSPQAIADLCLHAKNIIHQQSLEKMLFTPHAQWHEHEYEKGMLDGVHVLLVDDDERNLYSISQALDAQGMNICSVDSGAKALQEIEDNGDLQIVLLDIMMPDMDGYQVLNILRASHKLPQLPVIALTAKAMLGDKELCLSAGASAYLSKPIDMAALLNCIASHVLQTTVE